MRRLIVTILCVLALHDSPSSAQTRLALKNGESADVFPVYWISNCVSQLRSFGGIDVLEGPPGVSLSLKEGMVMARRQNCPNPVPGAMVVVTVRNAKQMSGATVTFRVRYVTFDGDRQSVHSFTLDVY